MEIVKKYFPELSEKQILQLTLLGDLYPSWNDKINVISRKDIEHLYERHILHSLGIAKIVRFSPLTSVMDVGTGGGFPGIPLAILFPEVRFLLIDSIGKKISVVQQIVQELKLSNVQALQTRAENVDEQFDFVVSRAVTRLKPFYGWVKNKFLKGEHNPLPNGILYLKGGDLQEELEELNRKAVVYPLNEYFQEEYFFTKKVVYISASKS